MKITQILKRNICTGVVCFLFAGIAAAHSGDADKQTDKRVLDAEQRPVAELLEAYAAAYQGGDIDAIKALTLADGRFSFFEGAGADSDWHEYEEHLAAEMPAFSEARYSITAIQPEVQGNMAFATFSWSMDVVIISDQFEGGRHPVSMQGLGTAVLIKQGEGWKIRHLHTARKTD
jgi:ketosteroid isomerase-like protein